jgi:ribosomal protein S18 acetylase RimI-like enzyme
MVSQLRTDQSVGRLARADKADAVEVLASAFQEYPVMQYVLKDAGNSYEEHLRALIGFFVESRLSRDWPLLGIRMNRQLVAVAAANSPGKKPRPPELQEVYVRMTGMIGREAIERLKAFERASSSFVPDKPFYYLGMIGVRPEWQGKRLARTLIDHLHGMSEADPVSTGVCLSTEDPANVPLYEHLGYRVLGEADVGEIHTWGMFRENTQQNMRSGS